MPWQCSPMQTKAQTPVRGQNPRDRDDGNVASGLLDSAYGDLDKSLTAVHASGLCAFHPQTGRLCHRFLEAALWQFATGGAGVARCRGYVLPAGSRRTMFDPDTRFHPSCGSTITDYRSVLFAIPVHRHVR